MNKILITGANGFIGSNIIIDLLENDFNIIGIDIAKRKQLLNKYIMASEKDNLLESLNIDLTKVNLIDIITEEEAKEINLLIHLASPIGVTKIKNDPLNTYNDAEKMNNNIIEFCSKYNINLIYSSSSEVFGTDSQEDPNKEFYKLPKVSDTNKRGSYALQKIVAEYKIQMSNINSHIVRFYNVSGTGQTTEGMAIPTFIKKCINNEDIIIPEDGIRTYCDIRDAVYQVRQIIQEMLQKTDNIKHLTTNIGNPKNEPIAASKLAETISAITISDSQIKIENNINEIPIRTYSETTKYNKILPNYSINQIIRSAIESYYEEL